MSKAAEKQQHGVVNRCQMHRYRPTVASSYCFVEFIDDFCSLVTELAVVLTQNYRFHKLSDWFVTWYYKGWFVVAYTSLLNHGYCSQRNCQQQFVVWCIMTSGSRKLSLQCFYETQSKKPHRIVNRGCIVLSQYKNISVTCAQHASLLVTSRLFRKKGEFLKLTESMQQLYRSAPLHHFLPMIPIVSQRSKLFSAASHHTGIVCGWGGIRRTDSR